MTVLYSAPPPVPGHVMHAATALKFQYCIHNSAIFEIADESPSLHNTQELTELNPTNSSSW